MNSGSDTSNIPPEMVNGSAESRERWWFSRWSATAGLWIGLISGLCFIALTSVRLNRQGFYYDELHAAPVVFDCFGRSPHRALVSVGDFPLLVGSYLGAIKPTIYAAYLFFFGDSFGVMSWRLLGILMVATGIFAFCSLVASRVSRGTLLLFLGLLCSDIFVLLNSRHDWGPVALALLGRLLFLGIAIRMATQEENSLALPGVIGLLVGLSIYDKLSNVVLLVPCVLCFLLLPPQRRLRNLLAGLVGLFIGAMPLLAANLVTWSQTRSFVSFREVSAPAEVRYRPPIEFLVGYLSNGTSPGIQTWMLGHQAPLLSVTAVPIIEAVLWGGVLVLASTIVFFDTGTAPRRLVAVLLVSYVGIALALYALPGPARSGPHHWVVGTPFQYAAIAIVLGTRRAALTWKARAATIGGWGLIVAILLTRLPAVYNVEESLFLGRSGKAYDPSLNRLGELASTKGNEAVFLATGWGVANQIYMFSNGRPNLVFWMHSTYRSSEDLRQVLKASGRRVAYTVSLDPPVTVSAASTRRIEEDFQQLAGWRQVPLDEEWQGLATVRLLKFVRSSASDR